MSKRNRRAGSAQSAPNRKRDKQERLQILADAVDRRNWMIQALEARMMLTSATVTGLPTWTQVGPVGIRDGQSLNTPAPNSSSGPNMVAGAVSAILFDPTVDFGQTMLVGTANG